MMELQIHHWILPELYASNYDFIHVYSYENAGISTTRNRALEKATGDLLFVC